jgi:hypothetical protein
MDSVVSEQQCGSAYRNKRRSFPASLRSPYKEHHFVNLPHMAGTVALPDCNRCSVALAKRTSYGSRRRLDRAARPSKAYAWSSPIYGSDKRRVYAVLHLGGIQTLVDVVRAAIVAERKAKL